MSDDIIRRAKKNSVHNENKKVIRRRKKIVNYLKTLLLIASISANVALVKNIDFSSPSNFSEITYGEDYDKEFDDVNELMESCIRSCIKTQINKDTHEVKDENGMATGEYYYNFTGDYTEIFSNLDVLINNYKMEIDEANNFTDYISQLSDEEKQAILVYYGTSLVNYDDAKESFKRHVGGDLIEKGASNQGIEALAENAVRKLTGNYLDGYWVDKSLGRSN